MRRPNDAEKNTGTLGQQGRHPDVTHFSASISIRLTLLQLAVAAMLLWFVVGEPVSDVANLLFSTGPAPWEEVDLVYYPDKYRRSVSQITPDLGSLEECRTRANYQAVQQDDQRMERGTYECRTASARLFSSQRVYRLSLK